MKHTLLLLVFIQLMACAHTNRGANTISGPNSSSLDLYRNPSTRDKLFVEIRLHDEVPRLFLLDTGSSLTALSHEVAMELNLPISPRPGKIVGIGGSTSWMGSVVPNLRIGAFAISNLPVAVGVPGIPTRVGMVPLAGIIGNDVLGQFQVVVDYPANRLLLGRAQTIEAPPHAVALFFNGQHAMVQTELLARDASGLTVRQKVLLEVDTGARGLLIMGGSDTNLSAVSSEGLEPITGVGSNNADTGVGLFRDTRRVPVGQFSIGGVELKGDFQAIWLDYKRPRRQHAPGMPGLAGYEVLKGHRVFLDYPGKKIALLPPDERRSHSDVHEWYLRHSRDADDAINRIKALFVLGRQEEAVRKMEKLARAPSKYPEAVSMLSRHHRAAGRTQEAHQLLKSLSIRDLVELGEIVAWVNGLWLQGHAGEAFQQAKLATVLSPKAVSSWLALADAAIANGESNKARAAIAEAVSVEANPDGHLLRRAFIATKDGDHDGAMAHLRRAIQIQPRVGYAHWLYSHLALGPERKALVRNDLLIAESRLHPGDGPLDFLAGAWTQLNDPERAERFMTDGLARDCSKAPDQPSQQNCTAWYHALTGTDLENAERMVETALAERPHRAEYLDTLAVVLEAQGRKRDARDAAWRAAMQVPDDVYLFTQALRLQGNQPVD